MLPWIGGGALAVLVALALAAGSAAWVLRGSLPTLAGELALPGLPAPAAMARGASQRMVVSPGRERDGFLHMQGGQSGHQLSRFWGAGHADWVDGGALPFLPGTTRHTLRLSSAPP